MNENQDSDQQGNNNSATDIGVINPDGSMEADLNTYIHEYSLYWERFFYIQLSFFAICLLTRMDIFTQIAMGGSILASASMAFPSRKAKHFQKGAPILKFSDIGLSITGNPPRSILWNDVDGKKSQISGRIWKLRSKSQPWIDPIKIYIRAYPKQAAARIMAHTSGDA